MGYVLESIEQDKNANAMHAGNHCVTCDTFPAHQKAIILEKACQPTGPTFDYTLPAPGGGSRPVSKHPDPLLTN
jgi:hypothetical protein